MQLSCQSCAHDMHLLPAAAQPVLLQERYIRVMKDNVNLESDFDHVLGQDASQEDVFDLARGKSATILAALGSSAGNVQASHLRCRVRANSTEGVQQRRFGLVRINLGCLIALASYQSSRQHLHLDVPHVEPCLVCLQRSHRQRQDIYHAGGL